MNDRVSQIAPTLEKDLNHYLGLRYTILITAEEDSWGASIVELPGCIAGGETIEETLATLTEAKEAWILSCLEDGDIVPEPMEHPRKILTQMRSLNR